MILQRSFIGSHCCHQSHGEPAVGAASAVPRRAADGTCGARLEAVPGGQHGLRPHPGAIHGETPGVGEAESRGLMFSRRKTLVVVKY